MSATSEQRRAAAVRRIKALGPQPRPVFRSGVDIDAIHYRLGALTSTAGTVSASPQLAPAAPAAPARPLPGALCAVANEGESA